MAIKTVYVNSIKEIEKGIFTDSEKETVDGQDLASKIEAACAELEASGYSVLNIMPVLSGDDTKGWRGFHYGYSYTSGVIITASK